MLTTVNRKTSNTNWQKCMQVHNQACDCRQNQGMSGAYLCSMTRVRGKATAGVAFRYMSNTSFTNIAAHTCPALSPWDPPAPPHPCLPLSRFQSSSVSSTCKQNLPTGQGTSTMHSSLNVYGQTSPSICPSRQPYTARWRQ